MSQHEKATPRPWSVGHTQKQHVDPRLGDWRETAIHVGEYDTRGNVVATAVMGGDGATRREREYVEANARLIVAAVNSYDAAGAAIEELRNSLIKCGELVGGQFDRERVSDAFLGHIPESIETKLSASRALIEQMRDALEREHACATWTFDGCQGCTTADAIIAADKFLEGK